MAEIGEPLRRVNVEPIPEPAEAPVVEPPVKEPTKEPAHAD
jgi:hypothetical protein